MDITSLYSVIPNNEALFALKYFLINSQNFPCGLAMYTVKSLLEVDGIKEDSSLPFNALLENVS